MQKNEIFFTTNEYENKPDEEIISYIKQGDEQALAYLLNKYRELVNIKISKFYMVGGERDDILQ